jgi:hypothetical protein
MYSFSFLIGMTIETIGDGGVETSELTVECMDLKELEHMVEIKPTR